MGFNNQVNYDPTLKLRQLELLYLELKRRLDTGNFTQSQQVVQVPSGGDISLDSPAFTGTPTAPTPVGGTNNTQIATTAFVMLALADLVASSPTALNTLNELAAALGNDANFSTTVFNALANKVDKTLTVNGKALNTNISITKADVGLGNIPNVDATNPANISQSASFRFTTDAEKTTWNSKQSSSIYLSAIAALSPSNDDILQLKAGSWVNRTLAQLKADLALNNVNNTSDLNKPISTATQAALDNKADLVGGKVPTSQLPSITIGETFFVVSQVAMLALTAQIGDIAVRGDQSNNKYMLTGTDPTVLGNWTLLSVVGGVSSVNSQTGAVTLGKTDIGLSNVPNVDATLRSNHTGSQAATTITEDSTHRFITDTERTTWNSKEDKILVNKTGHGYVVGEGVYKDSSGWHRSSNANSTITSRVDGVVISVTDANNFIVGRKGTKFAFTGTADSPYYLSSGSPNYTATEPTTVGQIRQILFETSSTAEATVVLSEPFELATASGLSDGDKGDITVSGSGTVWTIDNNVVSSTKIVDKAITLAKVADFSGASKLLGAGASGVGAAEIALGSGLSMTGNTLSATGGGGGGSNKLATLSSQSIVTTDSLVIDLTSYTGYNQIVIKAFGVTTTVSTNTIKLQTSHDNSSYTGTYVQGGTFGGDAVVLNNMNNLSTDNDYFELIIQRPETTTMWPRVRIKTANQDAGNNSVAGETSVAKGTAQAVRYIKLTNTSTTTTTSIPVIEIWGF